MTTAMVYVILTLTIPLALVFMNRLREDTAALAMVAALMVGQIAGLPVLGPAGESQSAELALRGFGSPTILTLISLFIMTASLEKYGLTSWIARKLTAIGGKSESRLIGLFSLSAALLSLVMSNMASGALLLPSALETSRQAGIKPSKLLIPIAMGAMMGGAATYLTTANIIIAGLLQSAVPPQEPLGFFDFTITGGIVVIAGVAFLTLFGSRLLPDREPGVTFKVPGSSGLTTTYQLQERLWEASIPEKSDLHQKTLAEANLGKSLGISILAVKRGQRILPIENSNFILQRGDTLFAIGRDERIESLKKLGFILKKPNSNNSFESSDLVFAEVIIPPHSDYEGKNLREISLRANFGFSAIALWRENRSFRTDLADFCLKAGDTLLLIGPAENLKRLRNVQHIILTASAINRNGMDKPRVLLTASIVLAAITAMILNIPVVIAALAAAVIMMLTGLISMEEAYQTINWRAVFLIAGIMSVSTAMVQTGLASFFGNGVINLVSPFGGMGLAVGTSLITAGLSQVMGSQITPLVIGPVVISSAIELGVNPQAIAVVTGISTATFYLTPLAHPVNLIMIGPANYEFRDFFKIGLWMSLVCFTTLIIATKLIWGL